MITVAACLFTRNRCGWLKTVLIHEMQWVDQVCILDMGSNDGTEDFCRAILRTNDIYVRRDKNTCPTEGFNEAKNFAMGLATTDWVYNTADNSVLDWAQRHQVKQDLEELKADCAFIKTINIKPLPDGFVDPSQFEKAINHPESVASSNNHVSFIRRGAGIQYKGYIHEEAYNGESKCAPVAAKTNLRRFHIDGWLNNDAIKQRRHFWMLRNAMRNPELQKYTSDWWYVKYYPEHKDEIDRLADDYERIGVGE